jgi:tRNA 2-thiocytidine biosynthesis protein TtcA
MEKVVEELPQLDGSLLQYKELDSIYKNISKLIPDAGTNTIIRPLAYCQEAEIARYAAERQFPIIPCNLCGSQPNMKRALVKQLVNELEKETQFIRSSIMSALTNVTGSHLLDNELYDFRNFEPVIKQIPAGHGSVERELDEIFDHSEPGFVPDLMGAAGLQ